MGAYVLLSALLLLSKVWGFVAPLRRLSGQLVQAAAAETSFMFPESMTDEWELDCYSRPGVFRAIQISICPSNSRDSV
jgi:hypothetical protein